MQAKNKRRRSIGIFLLVTAFSLINHQAISKSLVYFSPDDKPQTHLISYINGAKNRIYAAVYMFTDKQIAQALIDAKDRGVDVEIIADRTSLDSPYGKILFLQEHGVKTFIFKLKPTKYSRYGPLMHNKFAVIDNTVWTGSFNWTISANQRNQENVIYTDEKNVHEKFLTHFSILKERCSATPVGATPVPVQRTKPTELAQPTELTQLAQRTQPRKFQRARR